MESVIPTFTTLLLGIILIAGVSTGAIFFNKLIKMVNKLNESVNKLATKLKSPETSASDRFQASVDAQSQETIEDWLKVVANQQNENQKLQYLEAAINRFPAERELIVQLRDLLMPLAGNGSPDRSNSDAPGSQEGKPKQNNLLVRREALMRLREHANSFAEHCRIDDLPFALEFKQEVVASMEDVVASIDERRRNNISRLLQEMEGCIKKLEDDPPNTKLIEKVEQIDQQIDKSVLGNYPDLQTTYDQLSQWLMHILGTVEKQSKPKIKRLNENALKDGKAVLELLDDSFPKGYKSFIPGTSKQIDAGQLDLEEIARLLSRHDTDRLLPTTINYLRTVEAEVFSKLSPEGKITFTELMIQQSTE